MTPLLQAWWLGLLCCCLVTASFAQRVAPGIVLIGEGARDNVAFVYYQNEFQDQVQVLMKPDSATGRWAPRRLSTTHPLWLQLSQGMSQYALYARPDDTVHIQTNAVRPPFYTFRSPRTSAARLAELGFFESLKPHGLSINVPDFAGLFLNARYPRQAEQFCRKFDQRRAWLQRMQDSLHLAPAFVTFAHQQLRAQYLAALFHPYFDEERAFTQFPASYAQQLAASGAAQFLTNDSLARASPTYRGAAVGYVAYLSRDSMGTPAALAAQYHHARTGLSGRTRDYALFFLLKQNLGKQLSTYDSYLARFRRDCHTPAYVRYIDSVAARPAGLRTRPELAATPLRSSTGQTITWEQLLTQHRGNVLYLDVWASWCAPCLAEMPNSAKLQQALVGQPVQFVYLSIDTDATKWRQAIAAHQLARPGTEHYLLDPESELAKFLKVPPIPHYILLDKQGEAVSLDAARPGDPLLRPDLAKLLP